MCSHNWTVPGHFKLTVCYYYVNTHFQDFVQLAQSAVHFKKLDRDYGILLDTQCKCYTLPPFAPPHNLSRQAIRCKGELAPSAAACQQITLGSMLTLGYADGQVRVIIGRWARADWRGGPGVAPTPRRRRAAGGHLC